MSQTLTRFRKPGGFQQLVQLIETCEPQKKQNLLNLIAEEDPGWAHLLRFKVLSLERVLSWPVEVLMEILPRVPANVNASLLFSSDPNTREKLHQCIPRKQIIEISNSGDSLSITAGEKFSASIKLFQAIREMESKGELNLAQVDPQLHIDKRLVA